MSIEIAKTQLAEHAKYSDQKARIDQVVELASSQGGTVSFEVQVVHMDSNGKRTAVCPITINTDQAMELIEDEQRDVTSSLTVIENIFSSVQQGV